MSEDKKELNENDLDKVNGGACNPAEPAAELAEIKIDKLSGRSAADAIQ